MVVNTDANTSEFRFKARYGEVSMRREGNLVYGKFAGAVSSNLTSRLMAALPKLFAPLEGTRWGYISESENAQAATPAAEKELIDCTMIAYKMGCTCAAYIISSPLVIEQMSRVRLACGTTLPISDVLFDDVDSARAYILAQLALQSAKD